MKSFTKWQIDTEGIEKLFKGLDQNGTVWRCSDGGLIVADAAEFGPEHDDLDCVEDGTVSDWL